MDIVVAIGFNRNDGEGALSEFDQKAFVQSVESGIKQDNPGFDFYPKGVVNAKIVGISEGGDWGSEPGAWIAATISDEGLDYLKGWLGQTAWVYRQDAIAITVGGRVEFVKGKK